MDVSFPLVEALQLILVYRGGGEDEDSGFLGNGCFMLDNIFEILLVFVQGDVLRGAWETGIVGAEEYYLRC